MNRISVALAFSFLLAVPAVAAPYGVDKDHSAVLFSTTHFGAGLTHGRFNDFSGTFDLDDKKRKIEITVKTASVDSHHQKRDEHLRGPDFFNAKQFPKMEFKSTKIVAAGRGQLKVTGDLTLHGVTKSITFVAKKIGEGKDPWGGYRQGWTMDLVINRSDYGISFMPGGVGEKVNLTVSLEGVKK